MKSSLCQTAPAGPEDGPEEGEIVSDDLEDISDESISFTPCNGKSLSRSDHLHGLSLSSVTDFEDTSLERRRKRKKNQKHTKRTKRSRRKLIDSESSDDDTTLDRRLKLQLKAAIRVDEEDPHRNNSLRTRLRVMVQGTSGPDSDNGTNNQKIVENSLNNTVSGSDNVCNDVEKDLSVIEIDSDSIVSAPEIIPSTPEKILSTTEPVCNATENIESSSIQSKDDIELRELRIEALKTAIKNKLANRKRRKKDNTPVASSDETNKENTNNNNAESQGNKTENKVENPQILPQSETQPGNDTPPSPEEDEDVLRALLLASMSKKITSTETESTMVQTKPGVNLNKVTVNKININNFKLNNAKKNVNNFKNVINKTMGNRKLVKMPQVKPLIIKVNSDSESDLDLCSSPEKSPKRPQKIHEKDTNAKPLENGVVKNLKITIESSVDKFLKEQRAQVESENQSSKKTNINIVTNVAETKNINTVKDTAPVMSNKRLSVPIVTKNTQLTKKVTSKVNNISPKNTPDIIKIIPNATKTPHNLNTNTQNSKNMRLGTLEKSALKFLPENKREEYKKLQNLLKLRRAQLKKPRVRRISQRGDDNTKKILPNKNELVGGIQGTVKKNTSQIANSVSSCTTNATVSNLRVPVVPNNNPSATQVVPKATQNKGKPLNNNTLSNNVTQNMEVSMLMKNDVGNEVQKNLQLTVENQETQSDAMLLHTTLKQVQTRKDGRLQIQEKYKSLRPLAKKINDVSKEQKHWDQQVKKLLEQLEEARKNQHEFQETLSSLVKQFVERKKKIDESLAKNNKPKINKPITSTPLKQKPAETVLDISAVSSAVSSLSSLNTTEQGPSINIESTTIDNNKHDSDNLSVVPKESDNAKDMLNTWEQSTKIDNNIELKIPDNVTRVGSETDLSVVDPNDIDNIIRKTEEKVAVLEKRRSFECRRSEKVRYVSPLDPVKRKEEIDPFAIVCPFDVNGMCKDPECTFKHLSE